MITNELREKTLLVLDRQVAAICKDIIEDGCLSHNNSGLIVPLINLLALLHEMGTDNESDGDEHEPAG